MDYYIAGEDKQDIIIWIMIVRINLMKKTAQLVASDGTRECHEITEGICTHSSTMVGMAA